MGNFVVIGLDNFGYNVVLALVKRGHEVLAIDNNEEKVRDISDKVTKAVAIDLPGEKQLEKLVETSVDAVIVSMGDDIAGSVLIVMHLKELGINTIVAKAVSDVHDKILRLVGATETILAERSAAYGLVMKLTTKNLVEQIPLAEDYNIIELAIPDSFIGKTLAELDIRNRFNIEIIGIKNVLLNELYLIPKSSFRIQADCALIVIGKAEDTEKIKL
jgi:trk system potassium uptake protein